MISPPSSARRSSASGQAPGARVAGPGVGEGVRAALGLGLVQGGVGAAQEVPGVAAVGRADHDAGGRLDVDGRVVAERELLVQRLAQAGGEAGGLVLGGDGGREDGEGVGAEVRDGVERADGTGEALGHLDEHAIADLVAEDLVDLVEAVEVEQDEGEAPVVDRAVDSSRSARWFGRPVRGSCSSLWRVSASRSCRSLTSVMTPRSATGAHDGRAR